MTEQTALHRLLDLFRKASSNTSTQGRYFEKFCKEWLQVAPEYEEIDRVYLWSEWEKRGNTPDIGIDLVAETKDGRFWAIQCKFFEEGSVVPKDQIDSFLAAAGKSYSGASFSQLMIMSTAPLGPNALKTIQDHTPPCNVVRVDQFDDATFNWEKIADAFLKNGDILFGDARRAKKTPRPHQEKAIADVVLGLSATDRGKLIMACGTGKTFTSMKIMEEMAPENGVVLYLVPSLMLLAQTLKEWSRESSRALAPIVVCSDAQIHEGDARAGAVFAKTGKVAKKSKKDAETEEDEPIFSAEELTRPATTKPEIVVARWNELQESLARRKEKDPTAERIVVVFSTYQSIQTISDAQLKGDGAGAFFPEFDLVICDEAHRTTGASLGKKDESAFIKIHDNNAIRAKKRLYMTATPRVYGDAAVTKAKERDAVLCSMDDISLFGPELHHLSFGDAVKQGLLSDYRVLILAVTEDYARKYVGVCKTVEDVVRFKGGRKDFDPNDIDVDDLAKMIGCWRGLSKVGRSFGSGGCDFSGDPEPMKRAVAFCRSIVDSKNFAVAFQVLVDELVKEEESARALKASTFARDDGADAKSEEAPRAGEAATDENSNSLLRLETNHIDGTFNADERAKLLEWLGGETEGACRVLSNVRCLSEGVDVPNLDAALFISPRNSQVDVIQAVGRVMRKAPGKRFGYIILPVVVSENVSPEEALDDNERYRVIWQTLQAIRSHDERFRIMLNQLQVGENPDKLTAEIIGKPDGTGPDDRDVLEPDAVQMSFRGFYDDTIKEIFARIVKKCGDRNYLDQWAKEVAQMTATRVDFIRARLADPNPDQRAAFESFLKTLREDVNPNLDRDDAIDFLTQHLTTLPVFDAIFDQNAFSRNNPVALRIKEVVDAFEVALTPEEREREERFKEDVRAQIEGVTSAEGRRAVIHKLYEQFFNVALPKTAERLGVVYTPTEVVDYILHSVDYVLKEEFNRRLSNPTVHVLDPFTGTGAFICRLLQSGLIDREDMKRKYCEELHANEIMLLAYYIAAVNIEETYLAVLNDLKLKHYPEGSAAPFPGIVLTDTFQTTETKPEEYLPGAEKELNSARVKKQRRTQIEVIVGNPPYSVGQKSGNDNNQNEQYPKLDARVAETYAAKSSATLKNSLYDSYIKAFRWASDRIGERGVIGFVTNGAYIDNKAMEGFRQTLIEEFSTIYVFNLRGNQRTSGETSRREGGKIFGSGSRAPIAITILVKKPGKSKTKIFYRDIGDYLTRDQKLGIIDHFQSVENTPWEEITPNELGDWINQRGGDFSKLIPLRAKESGKLSFFEMSGVGVKTNRDAWVYDFSKDALEERIVRMIGFYNEQVEAFSQCPDKSDPRSFVDSDPQKIAWTRGLLNSLSSGKTFENDGRKIDIRTAIYRPFCKERLAFERFFIEVISSNPKYYPTPNTPNLTISIPNVGTKDFSTIITNTLSDFEIERGAQCFPLYYYEPAGDNLFSTDDDVVIDGYVQKSAITDAIFLKCQELYGSDVTREDIFFYVYGALHSPQYRQKYENELKKELARLPLPKTAAVFWSYSDAGRALADLHINYETGKSTIPDRSGALREELAPYPLTVETTNADGLDDKALYRVDAKMKLGTKKVADETGFERKVFTGALKYNDHILITGIPDRAFEYVVNGRSPIEWLVERYYRKLDKPSGIIDDPNLWSDDPKYIFNLIPRLVALSLKTLEIVERLPELE